MTKPFGYSCFVDMYNCDQTDCDDINICYDFLDTLVIEVLKMSKQSPPILFRSPPEYPGKKGLSGFIPLIESGVTIHTLTEKKFITLDVYSCRNFNLEEVEEYCRYFFSPGEIESQKFIRGTKYGEIYGI